MEDGFGSQRRHVDREDGEQSDNSWIRIINWVRVGT